VVVSRAVVLRFVAGVAAAAALAGCGVSGSHQDGGSEDAMVLHGHPRVVNPVAGQVASPTGGGAAASSAGAEEEPAEVSVSSGAGGSLPQPVSNNQILKELTQSGISANPDQATLAPDGLAIPPANAPTAVVNAIEAGNEIAHLPYVWGGGHMTYEDNGYDCSGSLSFILAAAGLLNGTETSGEFMSYGDAGLGKWITIYAMSGHTFAYIAGLRFDTVALAETGTRWSNKPADEPNLSSFVARHPPGL
jgi:hypothetical protein